MVSGGNRLTEISLDLADASTRSAPFVGCGKARDDGKVIIVDPTTLRLCPPGVVGEIWVNGSSVARGYWDNPTETEQTFNARLSSTGEGRSSALATWGFSDARNSSSPAT